MEFRNVVSLILIILLFIYTIRVSSFFNITKSFNLTQFISRVGVFSALASILYIIPVFNIKLPFFPSFLSLHFDEVPAFICGYAYGPFTAFAVICIKTIIKFPFSETLLVGELSDLLMSIFYVIPACIIYEKKRNFKGFLVGILLSSLIQILSALILNVIVLIPFYEFVMGFKEESLLALMQVAIPAIKDIRWSYGWICVVPFNLLKDSLVFILTFLIYRKIHLLLRYDGRKGIKKVG